MICLGHVSFRVLVLGSGFKLDLSFRGQGLSLGSLGFRLHVRWVALTARSLP